MELCSCFQRFEQKYLLDTDTYQKLRLELTPYMEHLFRYARSPAGS